MYIFVDEAGNLSDYSDSGSKFFVLSAVIADDHSPCNQLTDLRHDLEKESFSLPKGFHAKSDPRPRRERVFNRLNDMEIAIHVVAIKKDHVLHNLRKPESWVYGYAVKLLVTYICELDIHPSHRKRLVLPIYASGKLRQSTSAVCRRSVEEYSQNQFEIAIWETATHPGLQIADYCSWAVQRKLERGDDSAINKIRKQIKSAFSPWGVELKLE